MHHASAEPSTSVLSGRGRRSWRFVTGLLALSNLMEVVAFGHMEAFTPLFLEQQLGTADADVPFWTGLLAAATMAVAIPFAPFWGVLADRYSRKLIILRSLVIGAVAYGLASLTADVWQFLGVKLLFGLTFASHAIVVSTIALLAPERRIGLAIGLIQMAMPLGRAIGPLFGSWLIAQFGLRGMFVADAVVTAGAFAMVVLLFNEPLRRRDAGQGVVGRLGTVLGLIRRHPAIRLLFLLAFSIALMNSLITPFMPVAIGRAFAGEDVSLVIGVVLAGYGALAAISAPVAGRLGDRVGADRILVFATIGVGAMALGLAVATTPPLVAGVILLGGVPFGAQTTTVYSLLARVTPREHMAGVMGLTPMARNVAMMLGPLAGAALGGAGLRAVFASAAVASVLSIGMGVLLIASLASAARGGPQPHSH